MPEKLLSAVNNKVPCPVMIRFPVPLNTPLTAVITPSLWVLKIVSALSCRFVARLAEIPVAMLWFVNIGAVPSKMRVPLATVQAPPPVPVTLSWFTVKVPPVRLTVWLPEAGSTKSAMLSFPLGTPGGVHSAESFQFPDVEAVKVIAIAGLKQKTERRAPDKLQTSVFHIVQAS